ncbi:MAG: hypothetical protein EP330_22130 [Deltaproteobacteria bacterium]|nr:MAG: hypothetical protein EP330_22130 [Deltaproteobacteria bacterium]
MLWLFTTLALAGHPIAEAQEAWIEAVPTLAKKACRGDGAADCRHQVARDLTQVLTDADRFELREQLSARPALAEALAWTEQPEVMDWLFEHYEDCLAAQSAHLATEAPAWAARTCPKQDATCAETRTQWVRALVSPDAQVDADEAANALDELPDDPLTALLHAAIEGRCAPEGVTAAGLRAARR